MGTTASSGTNTAADLPDEALEDAAEEASAVVDSYIDGPYDPEIDTIPPIVLYWTRDIAAYLATLTWRKSKAPAPDNPVVARYQHALGMLQSVAAGLLTIMGPENAGDQPTVVNAYTGALFNTWNFDLTGESGDLRGWPLGYMSGYLYWTGYPN